MSDQPIPASTADDYKSEYVSYMTGLGVNMNNQTQSVSFDAAVLMHWLETVMPNADKLRVFMGRYPAGHPNAGRTTLVLWPYNGGSPATDHGNAIEPFNDGSLDP